MRPFQSAIELPPKPFNWFDSFDWFDKLTTGKLRADKLTTGKLRAGKFHRLTA